MSSKSQIYVMFVCAFIFVRKWGDNQDIHGKMNLNISGLDKLFPNWISRMSFFAVLALMTADIQENVEMARQMQIY